MSSVRDTLIHSGGVHAASAILGQHAEPALLAEMEQLRREAPEVMQASPDMVISWARQQLAYRIAAELGDSKQMSDIAAKQAKMIKDLH